LAVRAGKIRGQGCSARAEKRQGGILTEVGLQGKQVPPTGKAFGDFWLQKLQQKKIKHLLG